MMKLTSTLLLLALSASTAYAAAGNTGCCLCDDSCNVLNEDVVIETNDGTVVTCGQLSLSILEADSTQCAAAQETYALTCCADGNAPIVDFFLPDDFELIEEEDNEEPESLTSRITRMLWAVTLTSTTATPGKTSSWGSGNTVKTTPVTTKYTAPKTTTTGTTSTYKKTTTAATTSTMTSSNNGGGNSSNCSLCRDRSIPKKETQGVVVQHITLSFTGTCKGYDGKLKTLPGTHQMCKVSQAQFIDICGCSANYVQKQSDKDGYMGSWSWGN